MRVVKIKRTGLRTNQIEQQTDERRLPATRFAQDRRNTLRREVVGEIVENLFTSFFISKGEMLQAQSDAAGEQPIAFDRFVAYVLKLHQSLRSRKGTDEERDVARQLARWSLNLPYELDKSDECAVGN